MRDKYYDLSDKSRIELTQYWIDVHSHAKANNWDQTKLRISIYVELKRMLGID